MGTLLFLSLTSFIVVYSFSNKQRGKLGRAIPNYRLFFFPQNPKAKENANFCQSCQTLIQSSIFFLWKRLLSAGTSFSQGKMLISSLF